MDNVGFDVTDLLARVNDATQEVKTKLESMKALGSSISIADMFEMQMTMNRLAQLSEMSTGVVGASNSAISSMARGLKS